MRGQVFTRAFVVVAIFHTVESGIGIRGWEPIAKVRGKSGGAGWQMAPGMGLNPRRIHL